jgi:hypothetical protein
MGIVENPKAKDSNFNIDGNNKMDPSKWYKDIPDLTILKDLDDREMNLLVGIICFPNWIWLIT